MKSPTAAVLVIGNEILSGRTEDLNLNVIAKRLFGLGIALREARVVPDVEAEIVEAVNALRARYTYVFTTGGIGPTHDDITVASVATAFGAPVVESAEARARLESYYGAGNLNPARLRMALVPEGAALIDNSVSGAPGIKIGNVFLLAGVPSIMEAMLAAALGELQTGPRIHVASLHCFVAESLIADDLADVAKRFADLDIGSYPAFRNAQIGLTLVVRGTDAARVAEGAAAIAELIKARGEEPSVVKD